MDGGREREREGGREEEREGGRDGGRGIEKEREPWFDQDHSSLVMCHIMSIPCSQGL